MPPRSSPFNALGVDTTLSKSKYISHANPFGRCKIPLKITTGVEVQSRGGEQCSHIMQRRCVNVSAVQSCRTQQFLYHVCIFTVDIFFYYYTISFFLHGPRIKKTWCVCVCSRKSKMWRVSSTTMPLIKKCMSAVQCLRTLQTLECSIFSCTCTIHERNLKSHIVPASNHWIAEN